MGVDVTETYFSLCARTGGFDKRSEGTGQCGRLALQGRGCYVHLPATPLQGCHCRLPGEVQRGVGGGGTSITGKHSHQKIIFWEQGFFSSLLGEFVKGVSVCPLGGANHLSDDVVQGHGCLLGGRP